ncbi:MAG: M1 family metallopeptidase [Flavobacteriales bacterium]|nr:M1 family metallopeptidase [Flavobacteriales bacterium]
MKRIALFQVLLCMAVVAGAQNNTDHSKFRQLDMELPTPNVYRTGSGDAGHEYWQQKADYVIQAELDDAQHRITGSEVITYTNNSPDQLRYLWLQLDQNVRAKDADAISIRTGSLPDHMTLSQARWFLDSDFDGGFKIQEVKDKNGKNLSYTINRTMMRVDLPTPLAPHTSFTLSVKWWYNIQDQRQMGGRSGYEYFKDDDNYLYEVAQWFPRMAVYNDVNGWQHKQFLGRGEFTLPFGDYKVSLTVPADHVVAASGTLQNATQVLSSAQQNRLKTAGNAKEPVLIITPEEAKKNETSRSTAKKTWVFKADRVRDFAWASSRKFIWDACNVTIGNNHVLAMSYYPNEGNPLWSLYSTKAVMHTLRVYSKHTINYPYPVAISVNGPVGGMEYPMICFNGPRPEKDGTYSERSKYGLISVVIHEVGHNFFPMIVNSDERQWTWMDEGLNTFTQFLAEQEWEDNYPSRRGPANLIVDYMKGSQNTMVPIMTNSESLKQFGNNGYSKPAAALNILRETILGRELFDFSYKEYARRWAFKHPTPADFFRTMEDASGTDLDWFWRGWFFTTDHVDIALDKVTWYRIDTQNPDVEKPSQVAEKKEKPQNITVLRNKELHKLSDEDSTILDFYSNYDPLQVEPWDQSDYQKYLNSLTDEERAFVQSGKYFYQLDLRNVGGLVMPVIVKIDYTDGTSEVKRYPAEIWVMDNDSVSKVITTDKEVAQFTLDPFLETADTDEENNYFPRKVIPSRFQLYKQKEWNHQNPMQIKKEYDDKKQGSSGK